MIRTVRAEGDEHDHGDDADDDPSDQFRLLLLIDERCCALKSLRLRPARRARAPGRACTPGPTTPRRRCARDRRWRRRAASTTAGAPTSAAAPVRIACGIERCRRAIGRSRPSDANEPTGEDDQLQPERRAEERGDGARDGRERNRAEEEQPRGEDLADRESDGGDRPGDPRMPLLRVYARAGQTEGGRKAVEILEAALVAPGGARSRSTRTARMPSARAHPRCRPRRVADHHRVGGPRRRAGRAAPRRSKRAASSSRDRASRSPHRPRARDAARRRATSRDEFVSRPIFKPARAQLVEHGDRVLVQLEVLVQLPALRDVDGARVRRGLHAAHAEHDALGEREPDLVVVVELGVPLEMHERRVARLVEARRVERQPVALADAAT